jgi:hypothetical protein
LVVRFSSLWHLQTVYRLWYVVSYRVASTSSASDSPLMSADKTRP